MGKPPKSFNSSNSTPVQEIDGVGSETKGKPDVSVTKTNPDLARRKPNKYLNVNDLDVPPEVTQRFQRGGYGLRYVRFLKAGSSTEIDYSNIGKRIQQGYTFVSVKEAPELAMTSFKRDINMVGMDNGDFKDTIVKGDLALMKVPLINQEERRREVAELTRQHAQSVETDARRNKLLNASRSESRVYNVPKRGEGATVGFQTD